MVVNRIKNINPPNHYFNKPIVFWCSQFLYTPSPHANTHLKVKISGKISHWYISRVGLVHRYTTCGHTRCKQWLSVGWGSTLPFRGHVAMSEDVGSHNSEGYYWHLVCRDQNAVIHRTAPLAPKNKLMFLKLILTC